MPADRFSTPLVGVHVPPAENVLSRGEAKDGQDTVRVMPPLQVYGRLQEVLEMARGRRLRTLQQAA